VAAAGRQLDAIAALEAEGRLQEQPYVVRLVAEARRETPEATLGELAERLELHRSAVQRALERIERSAETEPAPPASRDDGTGTPSVREPSGMIRAHA
jgi:DNA-binding transcriptional regulator WhiA